MLSVQLQSSPMTIALVSDALADYLTHPLEDVDHWYAEDDGLFDAEPGITDELEAIAAWITTPQCCDGWIGTSTARFPAFRT